MLMAFNTVLTWYCWRTSVLSYLAGWIIGTASPLLVLKKAKNPFRTSGSSESSAGTSYSCNLSVFWCLSTCCGSCCLILKWFSMLCTPLSSSTRTATSTFFKLLSVVYQLIEISHIFSTHIQAALPLVLLCSVPLLPGPSSTHLGQVGNQTNIPDCFI